ncbi:MAG: hypothetical protein WC144_07565 [Sulfurimonas sp.]|nr:hypothetical protein [Sulfurimonadaceae bacterium]
MLKLYSAIKDSKNIAIVSSSDIKSLALASAIYSYVLQHHKKVSLHSDGFLKILPWSKDIKKQMPSSADLYISVGAKLENSLHIKSDLESLYKLLELVKSTTKLNQKIATALYISMLEMSDYFRSLDVDGMLFAFAKELLSGGAKHEECIKIAQRSLAAIRLESKMLREFVLVKNATIAVFELSDEDLDGATLDDAKRVLKRAFDLEYVKKSLLIFKQKQELAEIYVLSVSLEIVKFEKDYKNIEDILSRI